MRTIFFFKQTSLDSYKQAVKIPVLKSFKAKIKACCLQVREGSKIALFVCVKFKF